MEEGLCVLRLHWHVQNVNSVTTIPRKIRRRILTGWRLRNIVDSAKLIQCTKKPSNFRLAERVKIEIINFQSAGLCLRGIHKLVYANLSKAEIKAAQK